MYLDVPWMVLMLLDMCSIAEALLATAIGLFAAIPATIFYNYLTSDVQNIENKIDNFIGELNTLISRAIDEEKM